MARIIDLSIPLENDVPADPPFQKVQIAYRHHAETARELAMAFPGLRPDQLPDGEGWAVEQVNISTHNGTHVDAPGFIIRQRAAFARGRSTSCRSTGSSGRA